MFGREKFATQVISAVIVIVSGFVVPLQSWAHPEKTEPETGSGSAVRVTMAPFTNNAEQVVPQSKLAGIPATWDLTVPDPLPCNCTLNAGA